MTAQVPDSIIIFIAIAVIYLLICLFKVIREPYLKIFTLPSIKKAWKSFFMESIPDIINDINDSKPLIKKCVYWIVVPFILLFFIFICFLATPVILTSIKEHYSDCKNTKYSDYRFLKNIWRIKRKIKKKRRSIKHSMVGNTDINSVNKIFLTGNVASKVGFNKDKGILIFYLEVVDKVYEDDGTPTQFIDSEMYQIICCNDLAKEVQQSIERGMTIYIEGKIHSHRYKNENGIEICTKVIPIEKFEIIQEKKPEYYYLYFSRMGGIGSIECLDCRYSKGVVSSFHGFDDEGSPADMVIGVQCQSCGKFESLENWWSRNPPTLCKCGGTLERDKPLFCPKCKSKRLRYHMTLIT